MPFISFDATSQSKYTAKSCEVVSKFCWPLALIENPEKRVMRKQREQASKQCKQSTFSAPANLLGTPHILLLQSLHWLSFNLALIPFRMKSVILCQFMACSDVLAGERHVQSALKFLSEKVWLTHQCLWYVRLLFWLIIAIFLVYKH